MRGKKRLAARLGVVFILAAGFSTKLYRPESAYIDVIRKNWGVFLPAAKWEVYDAKTGASFLGDGVRYHVFRYQEEDAILDAVSWNQGRNPMVERKVDALLRDMEMEADFSVDFDEEYHYYTLINRGDSSELFLFSGTKTIVCGRGFYLTGSERRAVRPARQIKGKPNGFFTK